MAYRANFLSVFYSVREKSMESLRAIHFANEFQPNNSSLACALVSDPPVSKGSL